MGSDAWAWEIQMRNHENGRPTWEGVPFMRTGGVWGEMIAADKEYNDRLSEERERDEREESRKKQREKEREEEKEEKEKKEKKPQNPKK